MLSKYEEEVIAELDAQFEADYESWFEQVEEPSGESQLTNWVPSWNIGPAPMIAFLLAGLAVLWTARHTWALVRISDLSGASSAAITRAFGVVGCLMIVGSLLVLCGLLRKRLRPVVAQRDDGP